MEAQRDSASNNTAVDVVVLGEHPSAGLAAALLAQGGKVRLLHVTPPRSEKFVDRLVWINPALFDLSPVLAPVRDALPVKAIHGLRFLTEDPKVRSQYQAGSPVALLARLSDLKKAMTHLLKQAGVRCVSPRQFEIEEVDHHGLTLNLGKTATHARMMIVSDGLTEGQRAKLGLQGGWDADVLCRLSALRCPATHLSPGVTPAMLCMNVNLDQSHHFGWCWPGEQEVQLLVEEPLHRTTADSGSRLLQKWVAQLRAAGVLAADAKVTGTPQTWSVPCGGALVDEAVAKRTLLIGPAGGFISACGEEIYPGCWSAVFADKVARKALREPHLQDALQPFRHVWRTTLGEYMRGPRENLPFLLALIYRNATLTDRLAEAILLGKPVVR